MSVADVHGTRRQYDKGCRCDRCREAKRVAHKRWRDRQRAANSASYQRDLAASRALKARYRGSCRVCGKPTDGSSGRYRARELCVKHAAVERGLRMRGKGTTLARIIAFLEGGPRRFTEIIDGCGITKGTASNRLHHLVKYGLIERPSRGLYRLPERT